jgi:TolB-like protein/Tfp pilus assembly protein PilF
MIAPDVFLSYNREDADIARVYAEAFACEGLNVWWDATLRSGEAYDQVTEAALRGAKAVVVLWSPRSVGSRWVRAEATIADRNKTLLPVTIEPCQRPVMFELTQTADLSHWRGDSNDKAWRAFLDDVRRMAGRGEPRPVEAATATANVRGGLANVAVLPFTHRAGDEEMERLAEDLTEEITRELAPRRFYKVIAAGKMAAWRGKAIDYAALGRELDARYLVEGKLQRAGDMVRLTVQLIDAESANMLWSPRFARKADELVPSPEEFPVAVAAEISEHIVQLEMDRAMTKPGPWSGWEHVLRARAYIARQGPGTTRSYLEESRRAVAAAPDIGLAHAFLASALAELALVNGEKLDDTQIREIQAHIKRAMQLEGDDPTVISTLMPVYEALGEFETCLRLARRAVELYPTSTTAHFVLGRACLALGRTADAIAAFTRQDRLTAFGAVKVLGLVMLGIACLLEGQPVEAEAALDRALGLHPDSHVALKWKAIVAAHRGQEAQAIDAVRRLREVEPSMSIDQHVWQIVRSPKLAERTTQEVATLRRLWDATGGDA